jgi:hypothetical protein
MCCCACTAIASGSRTSRIASARQRSSLSRARTRTRAFVSEAHVANALEQRFLSRISDRRRALSGRSPIQAATHAALRQPDDQEARHEWPSLATVPDPTADVAGRLADRDDVGRLRELADELTADQRLVLACQSRSTWTARSSSGEHWAWQVRVPSPATQS